MNDLGYLTLPSVRSELLEGMKPALGGLTLATKDSFSIHTNICSTKLTQNGTTLFYNYILSFIFAFSHFIYIISGHGPSTIVWP